MSFLSHRHGLAMRALVALVVCTVQILAAGCRTATVHNVPRAAFTPSPVATVEQVGEAIWAAARREGWRTREVAPGKMVAEKTLRGHRALTEIDYDTTGYSLRLVEADNLLYDGTTVHETYNLWATQLEKRIEDEVQFRFR